jgi:hypothetical protein
MKTLKLAAVFALFAVPAAAEMGSVELPGVSQELATFTSGDRDRLRRNLEQAGFEHVEIEAVAYVVRARNGEGRQIVMHVEPRSGADALSVMDADDVVTGSIRTGH